MCTNMDNIATTKKRKSLKNKNNIGWKIVKVSTAGEYEAPFSNIFNYTYSTRKNRTVDDTVQNCLGNIFGGVFHLFSSRACGRDMLRVLKSKNHRMSIYNLKLVKVLYNNKDFYCVGDASNFSEVLMEAIKNHKNNSICVTAFTFAK